MNVLSYFVGWKNVLGRREIERRSEREGEKERQIYMEKGRNQNTKHGEEMLALSSILTSNAEAKGQNMAVPGRPAVSWMIVTRTSLF